MKKGALALFAAVILFAGISGCATERESQYTATGAGVGAVTGAILGGVIGGLSGHAGEGVVIGSLFGGLSGAAVGSNEYHMQRSEEIAAQRYAYHYDSERRDLLRIEDAVVNPHAVYPGQEVNLSMTYTLLTPHHYDQLVHEVREVRHDGRIIGRPELTTRRAGGTWASSVPVTIPPDAETGTYTVRMVVETDNAGDTRDTSFEVGSASHWRR